MRPAKHDVVGRGGAAHDQRLRWLDKQRDVRSIAMKNYERVGACPRGTRLRRERLRLKAAASRGGEQQRFILTSRKTGNDSG
jgi:hypothetical protein